VVAAAALAGLALIAWLIDVGWHAIVKPRAVADSCQVVGLSTGTTYRLDPEQLLNASIIADVAMRRGLPERAVLVALATAQQESKLRNLDYGDADSLGLFQQRTSQGWGSEAQIMTPTYAAGKFFDELVKVPSWQSLPVAEAAQAVQRSAFPDAYAQWELPATAYSAALTGDTSGQLTCRLGHPGASASTLTAATAAVTTDLRDDLEITSPSVAAVGEKQRAITVSGLAASGDGDDTTAKHRTSTVAAWAIAHAASRGITGVVVGDQEWRPDRDGWRRADQPAPTGAVVLTVALRSA